MTLPVTGALPRFTSMLMVAFVALCVGAGCEKKEEAPSEPATPVTAKPSAAKTAQRPTEGPLAELAPEEPQTKLSGVPLPEDLEEEAARTLSPDNLEAELDRLEAEITGD